MPLNFSDVVKELKIASLGHDAPAELYFRAFMNEGAMAISVTTPLAYAIIDKNAYMVYPLVGGRGAGAAYISVRHDPDEPEGHIAVFIEPITASSALEEIRGADGGNVYIDEKGLSDVEAKVAGVNAAARAEYSAHVVKEVNCVMEEAFTKVDHVLMEVWTADRDMRVSISPDRLYLPLQQQTEFSTDAEEPANSWFLKAIAGYVQVRVKYPGFIARGNASRFPHRGEATFATCYLSFTDDMRIALASCLGDILKRLRPSRKALGVAVNSRSMYSSMIYISTCKNGKAVALDFRNTSSYRGTWNNRLSGVIPESNMSRVFNEDTLYGPVDGITQDEVKRAADILRLDSELS